MTQIKGVFDIDELKEMQLKRGETCYTADDIAIVENLHQIDLDEDMRFNMLAFVYCKEGPANITYGDKKITIQKNDLIIGIPNQLLTKRSIQLDFDNLFLCVSRNFAHQIALLTYQGWDFFNNIRQHPVLHLTSDEGKIFESYFELISSKIKNPPHRYAGELFRSICQAFAYEMASEITQFVVEDKVQNKKFSSSEILFRNFMGILSEMMPKVRNVKYYAEQLNVTPKYLSQVCKENTGHSALAIIYSFIKKDIESCLKDRNKTIKEICFNLGFPNLSFFGHFVKEHIGMSPTEYREKNL